MHNFEQSISLTLPPMSVMYFKCVRKKPKKVVKAEKPVDEKTTKKTTAKKKTTKAKKTTAKTTKSEKTASAETSDKK